MEKGVKMFIYFSLIALITILSFSYLKYAGFLGYSSENEEIIPLSNGFCGDNECSFGENKINCPGDCDKISCDSWYDADGDGFGDLGECVGSNLYGCSGWIDNDLVRLQ